MSYKMQKFHLDLRKRTDNSYDILIDKGLLNKIPLDLKHKKIGNRYAIITDSNTVVFGKKLLGLMRRKGLKAELISLSDKAVTSIYFKILEKDEQVYKSVRKALQEAEEEYNFSKEKTDISVTAQPD